MVIFPQFLIIALLFECSQNKNENLLRRALWFLYNDYKLTYEHLYNDHKLTYGQLLVKADKASKNVNRLRIIILLQSL